MSIDAKVTRVERNEDGSGYLLLGPRGKEGPGQKRLYFEKSPKEVLNLTGREIWGGANEIILGREASIANRIGYTSIRFHDEVLINALASQTG